jgi:hypothetical protein
MFMSLYVFFVYILFYFRVFCSLQTYIIVCLCARFFLSHHDNMRGEKSEHNSLFVILKTLNPNLDLFFKKLLFFINACNCYICIFMIFYIFPSKICLIFSIFW